MADDDDKRKKRMRPGKGWFLLTGIVLVAGGAFVFGAYKLTGHTQAPGSTVTQAPQNQSITPGGKANPQYNQLVEQQNQQGAKDAAQKGQSFIPTVEGSSSGGISLSVPPAIAKNKPTPKPPKPADVNVKLAAAPKATQTQSSPRQSGVQANNDSPTMAELHQLMRQWSVPVQQDVVYQYKQQTRHGTSSQSTAKTRTRHGHAAARAKAAAAGPKPGDVYYAVMDTALDSDQPGPAMATIVSGKHKGARLLGGFKRHKSALVVQFSQMIPSTGKARKIKAYAVNTSTTRTSVATAVNHHYLARWGGLLAASFVEGFGQAVQQSGSTVVTSVGSGGGSTLVANPSRTAGAEAVQALGTVGQKAGQQIQKTFNEPPTVKVAAGTAIDVLVIKGH